MTSQGIIANKLEYCKRPGAFGTAGDKLNIPLCEASTKTMKYMISQAEQQMESLDIPEAAETFARKKLETNALNWLSSNLDPQKYSKFLASIPPPTIQDKIDFYIEQYTDRHGIPPSVPNVPSITTLQPPKNSNTTFIVQSSIRIPYHENDYAYHFSKHIVPRGGYYLDGVDYSGTADDPPQGRKVHKYEVDEMITYLDGDTWENGHYHDYRRLPKSIRDAYAKIIIFNLSHDPEIRNLLGDSILVSTWT